MEAKNRVKRLDLVTSGQSSIIPYRRQHRKPSQWGKKRKKAKWFEEALQIAEGRREAKSKGERERDTQLNVEFQRTARTDKKAFLNEQSKECRTTTERVRLEISSRNLEKSKEHLFHPKMDTIKDRNSKDLIEAKEIKKRWKEYT